VIVDTSAIVAIIRREPEAERFLMALAVAERRRLSAGNWVELGAVASTKGDAELPQVLAALLTSLAIEIEPVCAEQARIGHDAYRVFGKGHHRARLNFGDCFAYALAKAFGEPLLFKGDDFNHTDLLFAQASAYDR
jgi:ribonuclease VapC